MNEMSALSKSFVKSEKKVKENPLLAEISKLSAKVSELSTVRDEILDLKKQISRNNQGNQNQGTSFGSNSAGNNFQGDFRANNYSGNNRRRSRRVFKCQNCERTNSFCNHCFGCGESGHRKNECPKNQ